MKTPLDFNGVAPCTYIRIYVNQQGFISKSQMPLHKVANDDMPLPESDILLSKSIVSSRRYSKSAIPDISVPAARTCQISESTACHLMAHERNYGVAVPGTADQSCLIYDNSDNIRTQLGGVKCGHDM